MRVVFRGLYLAIHGVTLLFFVLGLLGRYIHPAIAWWLQPMAIALPLGALALLILTVTAGVAGRWVLFGISAAALAAFALRYAAGVGGDPGARGNVLTVVSFNTGDVPVDGPAERGISALVRNYEPDVLALQEFPVRERGPHASVGGRMEELFASLDYAVVGPRPPDHYRSPPPVITKLPVEQSSVIGLPSVYEAGHSGTILRVQLRYRGQSIVIYNVHLQSFTTQRPWLEGETFNIRAWIRFLRRTSQAFIQRAAEAEKIRSMMDEEELPLLLCGDFNTTPHQWVYAALVDNLQDAFREAGGWRGATFPAALPLVRIDFILAGQPFRAVEAEVGPRLPPDHRPVIAWLSLEGPGPRR